jgi:hypothetical protein
VIVKWPVKPSSIQLPSRIDEKDIPFDKEYRSTKMGEAFVWKKPHELAKHFLLKTYVKDGKSEKI